MLHGCSRLCASDAVQLTVLLFKPWLQDLSRSPSYDTCVARLTLPSLFIQYTYTQSQDLQPTPWPPFVAAPPHSAVLSAWRPD